MIAGARLYGDLADWWPLMSAPADYAEEAGLLAGRLRAACDGPARTLLELGSGGGNNASHLRSEFDLTLVEPSEGMLAVSRRLNPDCEHLAGDMRSVRLDRTFDLVLVHDAIGYMTSEIDLARAFETAFLHLRPGGAAVFVPDFVRETFRPGVSTGGHDGESRGLRYLAWTWDPDPADETYVVDYAFMLRDDFATRVEHDRHVVGLFPRSRWLALLRDACFSADRVGVPHSELPDREMEVFIGKRPAAKGVS